MYGTLAVIIVHMICVTKPTLSDKLPGDQTLSKGVASVVESWLSAVDNLVVVYRGLDVDVPCLKDDKNDDLEQTVVSNKSYVWYDSDNNTVSPAKLYRLVQKSGVIAYFCLLLNALTKSNKF